MEIRLAERGGVRFVECAAKEFLSEARRGKSFRALKDRTEAETGLCSE